MTNPIPSKPVAHLSVWGKSLLKEINKDLKSLSHYSHVATKRVEHFVASTSLFKNWKHYQAQQTAHNAVRAYERVLNNPNSSMERLMSTALCVLNTKLVSKRERISALETIHTYAEARDVSKLAQVLARAHAGQTSLSVADQKQIWKVIGEVGNRVSPLIAVAKVDLDKVVLRAQVQEAMSAVDTRDLSRRQVATRRPREVAKITPVHVATVVKLTPPAKVVGSFFKPELPKEETDHKVGVSMDVWDDWFVNGKTGDLYRKAWEKSGTGFTNVGDVPVW